MLPFHGKYPKLDPKSCVMPGAELAGDVELKEYASIWQNCALRGDVNKIVVGRYSNVQDNSVLHVDDDKACVLGDYVTIGHGAIVHASTIEDNVLVGMGAIVLSGCHIGSGSIIAAGAVLKENTVIPPNSLVVGIPARVVRTDETQIERIHNQALKYKHLWTVEYGMLHALLGSYPLLLVCQHQEFGRLLSSGKCLIELLLSHQKNLLMKLRLRI